MLCFTLYLRTISEYKPPGGLYLEGRFNGGVLRKEFGVLIFGGAFTWRGLFSKFYGIFPKTGVKIKCDFLGALVLVMYKYKYKKTFVIGSTQRDLITINYNKI